MPKKKAADVLSAIKRVRDSGPWSGWRQRAWQIVDRYTLEDGSTPGRRRRPAGHANFLWPSVKVLKPALFSQEPEVIAERRHKDKDPTGRLAALSIERLANVWMERSGFRESFEQLVLDTLLVGRGVAWLRYEDKPRPPVVVVPVMTPEGVVAVQDADGAQYPPDQAVQKGDELVVEVEGRADQRVVVDYVHWTDFAHADERNWADIRRRGWVARRMFMSREEGMRRFGRKWTTEIKMTAAAATTRGDERRRRGDRQPEPTLAEVWEVWDAALKKVMFVAEGATDFLRVEDDPYGIEGFFPVPRPVFSTVANESMLPRPDFLQYEAAARELEETTARISALTESLKAVGMYDAAVESLGQLLKQSDRTMLPVTNFADLMSKGGIEHVVQFLPVEQIARVLQGLYAARDQAKALMYEISGISDIQRGAVDPKEKASQSQLKARYAGQRTEQGRRHVERCAREAISIGVDMMLSLFDDETIRTESGFDYLPEIEEILNAPPPEQAAPAPGGMPAPQPAPQDMVEQRWGSVIALLRDRRMRDIRIDVEPDSAISVNEQDEQERREKAIQAVGAMLNNTTALSQSVPIFIPLLGDLTQFALRGYRHGRSLEARLSETMDALQQFAEQQQQAQQQAQQAEQAQGAQAEQPDPAAQAEAQIAAQEGQLRIQRLQQQVAFERQEQALKLQRLAQQVQADQMPAQQPPVVG